MFSSAHLIFLLRLASSPCRNRPFSTVFDVFGLFTQAILLFSFEVSTGTEGIEQKSLTSIFYHPFIKIVRILIFFSWLLSMSTCSMCQYSNGTKRRRLYLFSTINTNGLKRASEFFHLIFNLTLSRQTFFGTEKWVDLGQFWQLNDNYLIKAWMMSTSDALDRVLTTNFRNTVG